MRTKIIVFLVLTLLLALTAVAAASSQLASGFSIPWWTVDGGGGVSQGGAYTLSGTTGQADAGNASGGTYSLSGGFWSVTLVRFRNYLPVVRR
jgi:hypothetical protein